MIVIRMKIFLFEKKDLIEKEDRIGESYAIKKFRKKLGNSLQVGEGNEKWTSLVVYWKRGCERGQKIESKNCMFEVYDVNEYQIEIFL